MFRDLTLKIAQWRLLLLQLKRKNSVNLEEIQEAVLLKSEDKFIEY